MRLCRFGEDRLGVVEGTTVRDVTAALEMAARMPPAPPWVDALRYLTALVEDEIADTVPPARLTVVR